MSRTTRRTASLIRPVTHISPCRLILPVLLLVYLATPAALRAQEEKLPKAEKILDKYVYLATPAALRAQEEKLPKAEKILDKYVEVTGGKTAYAKINNRVTKATMEFMGQGISMEMTIYGARPNKSRLVAESEAIGKIEKGTNGDVAWELNVMTGPQVKEGEEKALMLRSAAFDGTVEWRKHFKKVECVGVEPVDDKPCYKVVLTPKGGEPETRYYDKASGLLVKNEMTLVIPMGAVPIETYISDYKEVDGIQIPHKSRVVVMGQERIMTVNSIEHDVKLPPDRFELPDEIKELLEEQKTEEAGAETP